MPSVQLVRSVSSDEKSHSVLERLRKICEELECPLVRPVKVIDRQNDRRSSCQIDEGRGEGAEASIAHIRIGERVGLGFRPPVDLRYAAQRIDKWPERPARFRFDALPVKDLGTRGPPLRQERGEKASFADPRIATDEGGTTRAAERLPEQGIERGKLRLAAYEGRTKDSVRRGGSTYSAHRFTAWRSGLQRVRVLPFVRDAAFLAGLALALDLLLVLEVGRLDFTRSGSFFLPVSRFHSS
jgi:hypothetical protein